MEGFYGFEVHAGSPAVHPSIPEGCVFRVMQVAVPAGSADAVSLRIAMGGQSPAFVLATLNPKKALYHASLDAVVNAKQAAAFTAEGVGAVHVSGYIQPAMDADDDFFDDDDDDALEVDDDGSDVYFTDEEEEEEEETLPVGKRQRKGPPHGKAPAKHPRKEGSNSDGRQQRKRK